MSKTLEGASRSDGEGIERLLVPRVEHLAFSKHATPDVQRQQVKRMASPGKAVIHHAVLR